MDKTKWINTFKFLAAYLVAAWTFLQFVDWVLIRYNISPYWVDVLLWIFIGIIPSVLIYFFHRDRINKRILKLREKIIFPLNVILLAIGLYFGFGQSDLGATTKEINYTDEQGEAQSKTITKEEFRIGVPIYGFENINKDESIDWWRYGIGRLLEEDLFQNKSISPDFSYMTKTSDKIREASLFHDFYVDGKYEKRNDTINITTYVRKASNGKAVNQQTFSGTEFLDLLDEISVYLTEQSGFVETNTLRYLDLPIKEFASSSEEALKAFVHGRYDKAVSLDSTFALAYLSSAKRSLRYNRGLLEVQSVIDKAFAYRRKLPLQKQLEVNIQRNLAYENYDVAEEQVKLQLEVDPNNDFYNEVLFSIYGETKDTKKFLDKSFKLFESDPKSDTGIALAVASMTHGEDQMLIDEISKYELINSALKTFKIQPYIFLGEIERAEKLLNEVKTLFPFWENRWSVFDSIIHYQKNGNFNVKGLEKFVGHYRSDVSEQTMNFWIANHRIIRFVKNQQMFPLTSSGEHSIGGGFLNDRTWKNDLIFDDNGKTLGVVSYQYDQRNTLTSWYWKEDQSILDAHKAYKDKDFAKAEKLYEIAYANNPKHAYLKNILDHLKYVKNTDTQTFNNQHKGFAGNYGPREFYIEDGRFYYKRRSENSSLPKVELLALDANSYMDLTRLNTIMEFVEDSNGKLASYSHQFIVTDQKFTWEPSDKENNYFLKDN